MDKANNLRKRTFISLIIFYKNMKETDYTLAEG